MGALAKAAHSDGGQFNSVGELSNFVLQKWNDMTESHTNHLVKSMQTRCLKGCEGGRFKDHVVRCPHAFATMEKSHRVNTYARVFQCLVREKKN